MTTQPTGLEALRTRLAETNDLLNTMSILNWDARVMMPPGGHEARGEQLATLARLVRDRFASDATGEALEAAEKAVAHRGSDDLADLYAHREVEHAREAFDIMRRVPERLVSELTVARTVAQPVWAEARATNDYPRFAPHLEKVLELTRELAEHIGYDEHPYDAMMKQYEPGMKVSRLTPFLESLRRILLPLLERVEQSDRTVPREILSRGYPARGQRQFGLAIAKAFGWDPSRGRLDKSVHPFEISFGRNDVRMTTRYREDHLSMALYGIMHETGHALYEQNVDSKLSRTALTTDLLGMYAVAGASFGAHESQSRLWENMVGRSRAFWKRHLPDLKAIFPQQLEGVDAEAMYRAVNDVRPSLIRVEADELTYNLHIMLRTEIEMGMLDGSIGVDELPDAWNQRMEAYLGLVPPNDATGVLQDIHWSHGHIGTFPTYSIGNVMGAQLFAAAHEQVSGLDDSLAAGEYATLLGWLKENVYRHGRAFGPDELLERATGRTLDPEPFGAYLTAKYEDLYPLD